MLLRQNGFKNRHIAELYGVSESAIEHINRGRSWKHITRM